MSAAKLLIKNLLARRHRELWITTINRDDLRSRLFKAKESYTDFVHFTSTSTGQVVTLNRRLGNLLWEKDLGSPVIGVYLLDSEGLLSLPFTSLANQTLSYLQTELVANGGLLESANHMKLYPTIYIGEHVHGLFALPSLVDKNYVTIGNSNGPLLLGGPHAPDHVVHPDYPIPGYNYHLPNGAESNGQVLFQSLPSFMQSVVGYYNVPSFSSQKFLTNNKEIIILKDTDDISDHTNGKDGERTRRAQIDFITIEEKKDEESGSVWGWFDTQHKALKLWINQQENKGLKISLIIMAGCVIAMFWYLQIQVREFQSQSRNNSQSSQQNFKHISTSTTLAEELPNGLVKVGKITFHPDQVLGKGCDGTFVYRGEFDSRRVAVKRLLPECFTFADREVSLLRESDAHPNVIRYYCMEQDRMFRYIALELCQATVTEYIQGNCDICPITPLEILRQATSGLCHLHSLDIVHRDIKPRNVLISVPNNRGQVKVMISDFGLCKKLQVGRVSFSRRSGVTGTDGWIAPEMLNSTERTTYAVDMFSLGCLYYYVLSKGRHPFGDSLRRQANILSGKYDLSELKGPDWMKNLHSNLISALISPEPELRPSCKAALDHPIYWKHDYVLNFFQEVSDRVEKSFPEDSILLELEADSSHIVKIDWRAHIHEEVSSDLKKYRSYQGYSVRDLLRALRNKKHHFRELSPEAQKILGKDSESFTNYWLSRFPLLLVHTWIVMQNVADEDHFLKFYHTSFRYPLELYREQMLEYVSKNPPILPPDYVPPAEQNASEDPSGVVRRNTKYPSTTGSPRRKSDHNKVPNDLVKSGGLYRNFKEEATNGVKFYQQKKKKTKKSDEPLVWSIN